MLAYHVHSVYTGEQCTRETCVCARYRSISGWRNVARSTNPWSILRCRIIDMRLWTIKLFHLNCSLLSSPDLNPFDYSIWGILQEKEYKTCITDVDLLSDEWLLQWRCDAAWPVPFSIAILFRPDQLCTFCTPSFAVFPTSNGFKSGEFGDHSWDEINLNNSVIAQARWAF